MIETHYRPSIPNTCNSQSQGFYIAKPRKIMGISVLVVGGKNFLTTFIKRFIQLFEDKIEVSSTTDIEPLVQKQQPDILILQANYPQDSISYFKLKKQAKLGLVYCIVIEDCGQKSLTVTETFHRNAQALEKGADAYLQINSQVSALEEGLQTEQENRLVMAQIEVGLRQVKEYREMRKTNDLLSTIALADPLTGLSNRRALEWELLRQIEKSLPNSIPLSLIILDVDHFKSVNDRYGHLAGDRVLLLLAERLKKHLRTQDHIFRYGGEEFVILLGQIDLEKALPIAERLLQIVAEQPFCINSTLSLSITISVGLASLIKTDDHKGISLLRRADENLLIAKSNGRNQVVTEVIAESF